MVISPLLRGLFGLEVDAGSHQLILAPHVPADWTWFTLDNLHVGTASLRVVYRKTASEISLEVSRRGNGDCSLEFSPAVSLHAQIAGVELNRRRVPFQIHKSDVDQHVSVRVPMNTGPDTLRIRLKNDFGLSLSPALPPLGSASQGLRVISESWAPAHDSLTLEVSGSPGGQYEIGVWNSAQVTSVEGAELVRPDATSARIKVKIPANASEPYPRESIVIHFTGKTH
jgi:hypothetical protein